MCHCLGFAFFIIDKNLAHATLQVLPDESDSMQTTSREDLMRSTLILAASIAVLGSTAAFAQSTVITKMPVGYEYVPSFNGTMIASSSGNKFEHAGRLVGLVREKKSRNMVAGVVA